MLEVIQAIDSWPKALVAVVLIVAVAYAVVAFIRSFQ
jgi:hypothetical protein